MLHKNLYQLHKRLRCKKKQRRTSKRKQHAPSQKCARQQVTRLFVGAVWRALSERLLEESSSFSVQNPIFPTSYQRCARKQPIPIRQSVRFKRTTPSLPQRATSRTFPPSTHKPTTIDGARQTDPSALLDERTLCQLPSLSYNVSRTKQRLSTFSWPWVLVLHLMSVPSLTCFALPT